MRLANFIEHAQDDIVAEAIAFARTITAISQAEVSVLRNHIPEMLQQISADLRTAQSRAESIAKSRGQAAAAHLYSEADGHGLQRAHVGLNIDQLVAEYRALRSSVLRLWTQRFPPEPEALGDMVRFNEAIDQAIAESVRTFGKETEDRRQYFLAALGHDLRSPLSAVTLTASALALGKTQGGPQLEAYTQVLSRSADRMTKLLESLLNYNLVGLGRRMVLNRAPVDLAGECAQEVEILRAAFPHRDIDLTISGDCRGHFDASRMREALTNLVSNAARHGVASEPVQVTLLGSDDAVELSVANAVHAPMSASELALLFEPLRRGAAKAAAGERASLGLGLFITQEIAQAHGGNVSAVCEGRRICFTVSVPKQVEAVGSA